MVHIDLTLPAVAATNAADATAGGIVQGQQTAFHNHLAEQELEIMQRQAAAKEAALAEETNLRKLQIQKLNAQTTGETGAYEQYLKMRGVQFQPHAVEGPRTGNLAHFGGSDSAESSIAPDEKAQLDQYLQKQRQNVLDYAAGFDDDTKRAFYQRFLPLLDEDENEEKQAVAARGWSRTLKEGLNSGFFDEEESAILEHALQGLHTGEEDAHSISQMWGPLSKTARDRFVRGQNFNAGMGWAQKQIEEAVAGGVDPKGLHDVVGDWIVSKDLDPKKLQAAVLEKRYGLKPATIKIGKSELPKTATLKQWQDVAGAEADHAVTDILSKDPFVAQRLKDTQHPLSAQEYTAMRDALRRGVMRSFGAQAGIDENTLTALGFGDQQPEQMKVGAEAEIRAKLKAAGIDPDTQLPPPAPRKKGAIQMRPMPTTRKGPTSAPVQADDNDLNADGVYDEKDLDKQYTGVDGD